MSARLITTLLMPGAVYLIVAFTLWDMDAREWLAETRLACVAFAILGAFGSWTYPGWRE